ncbi:MAG: folD [Fibrobacteria bacterium]|jgi:methylenetetrahydrofolate dehydrogenase (NADP+)/methenyltetrahydrofolate cyclohydrolase|nr:folD [Fibrobacteria bacterium]
MSQLLDGKKTAQEIRDLLKGRVARLKDKGVVPGLSVTLVGEDPASKVYVGAKDAAAKEVGMHATTHRLPAGISEADLRAHLIAQNNDAAVHGILLQLPLPKHLPEESLLDLIAAEKDVDGFHPVSLGNVMLGRPGFKPCTPWGVQVLLRRYGISLKGKHVVIVGRSNIVGKPLANLLVQKADDADATVTVCHSGTKDLARYTRDADVLVAAIGRGEFITADMVKDGAVVVDVGMNRVDDAALPKGYRLCGDVDFKAVEPKAASITPVPGGVGPMTIAMLLSNTVWSAERAAGIESAQDPFAN